MFPLRAPPPFFEPPRRSRHVSFTFHSLRADFDMSFAPGGLASHSGPRRYFQVGDKLGQGAVVFGFAHEAGERVAPAGLAAAALGVLPFEIGARQPDGPGPLAQGGEVQRQRTLAVELAEGMD